MSLGTGLGKLAGKVFRIGHLGYFNDLMLCGTLCRRRDGPRAARRAASQGRRAGGARRILQQDGTTATIDGATTRRMSVTAASRATPITTRQ